MGTYSIGNGQLHQMTMEQIANTLDCMHDQQMIIGGGVTRWTGNMCFAA